MLCCNATFVFDGAFCRGFTGRLRPLRTARFGTYSKHTWKRPVGRKGQKLRLHLAAAAAAAAFYRLRSRRQKVFSQSWVSHAFFQGCHWRAGTWTPDSTNTLPKEGTILHVVVLCPKKTPKQFFLQSPALDSAVQWCIHEGEAHILFGFFPSLCLSCLDVPSSSLYSWWVAV